MVLVIILFVKPTLGKLGQKRMDMQVASMKWMQQGVFGIKDVKVSRKEGYFLNRFSEAYGGLTASKRSYAVLNNTPRLVIETVCIVGMLGYMFIKVVTGGDLNGLLPQLTAFGGAAIRLMPSVNRISTYLSSIAYFEPSLDYVCDHLDLASLEDVRIPEEGKPLPLSGEILLKDIRFRYPGTEKDIFEHADMRIPVGSSVGVVGASGAGKTTVIDILLGLLSPQEGSLVVNGEKLRGDDPRWLASIGYIAQNIYMLDDTIRANVAFGVPDAEVDEARIREVLKEAQLEEFIDTLPEGLDAVIGDRGVRISGGQRQRIGIARALYHDPELLVFDEATSALDNDTEAAIMDAINALKGRKTMVIIAHRLKTIENCDIVYRVENGQITEEPQQQAAKA
ncbi:MAG: ABC transporter ATP-binding protein, partial [Lachnospiraceae bacterium]|nr:ABC transporter ATP-binding protein [Lachnospiraceae bacterium]